MLPNPQETNINGFKIKLVSVTPYPKLNQILDPVGYNITIKVEK